MSIICKDGKPYDTVWDMHIEDFEDYMREPTQEERKAINEIEYLIGDGVVLEYIYVTLPQESIDALKVAIKALEKQIPQAVKYNNRHGDGYDYYNRDYFNCPACGRRLRNKQKDPYCPKCGQAIKWE